MRLGLKAGINDQQIADRMQYQPTYFEFHLTAEDVTPTGLVRLREKKFVMYAVSRLNGLFYTTQ